MDASRIIDALAAAGEPGPPRLELLAPAAGRGGPVGIVPGSFDPITRAHVALAEALRRRGADPALFVYSARTLAKEGPPAPPPLLPPERRLAAVTAVCEGGTGLGLAVCSHGLVADQAEAAAASFPGARPLVALGSDKLRQLFDPRWYDDRDAALERLFAAADVAFAVRAGDEPVVGAVLSANPRWAGSVERIDLPPTVAGISSSAVRQRLRRGQDVSDLVPPEAAPFVGEGLG
ncbi:MAG: hypothetical protein ACRDI0_13350 [Actinomycetota bacterium]